MILEAIAGIMAQDFQDWELLVEDGGESVEGILPRDPRIKYYPQIDPLDRRGDMVMRLARGELLNYHADDDFNNFCAVQRRTLQSGTSITGSTPKSNFSRMLRTHTIVKLAGAKAMEQVSGRRHLFALACANSVRHVRKRCCWHAPKWC